MVAKLKNCLQEIIEISKEDGCKYIQIHSENDIIEMKNNDINIDIFEDGIEIKGINTLFGVDVDYDKNHNKYIDIFINKRNIINITQLDIWKNFKLELDNINYIFRVA